jgi:hypothetical protein
MSEQRPSLNRPCPCGSGKKYKRCCSWREGRLPEKRHPMPEFQQLYLDHQAHQEQLSLAETMRELDEAKERKRELVKEFETDESLSIPVCCCDPMNVIVVFTNVPDDLECGYSPCDCGCEQC